MSIGYRQRADGCVYPRRIAGYEENFQPVLVIGANDFVAAERLARAWESTMSADLLNEAMTINGLHMLAAVRSLLNPAQPKPEEPTGLGAVVEDRLGRRWVRWSHRDRWRLDDDNTDGATYGTWSQIDAVHILSHGVTA